MIACFYTLLPFCTEFLCTIGIGTCVYYVFVLFKNLKSCYRGFVLPQLEYQSNKDLVHKYGSWAVITGATDGIGLAYAKELAARKVNIVLISRTEEKLKRVSAEIEDEYSVKTKIITADFREGRLVYERIENELKHLPIGILVNNVGMFLPSLSLFTEMTEDSICDMVNVNILPVLLMTKMILPQMKRNRRGAIVNVSSIFELQPTPFATVYSATKVFIRNFTKALQYENHKYGLTIQILSPSVVKTHLSSFTNHKLAHPNEFITPTAKEYARQAIGTLGVLDHTAGYNLHCLLTTIGGLLPEDLRTILLGYLMRIVRKSNLK